MYPRVKRLLDVVLGVTLLVIVAPVFLVAATAVALESPGNPLFRQRRVGLHGNCFWLYKIRSMHAGADRDGRFRTEAGDPRITKVGRFLRSTSIDELPQLWNVIRGDMSLVGPRPDVPEQRADYTPEQWALRTAVRPGLTGPAQATLRSSASRDQRLALDLQYVSDASLSQDVKILLLTMRQVFGKGGF